jgi:HK97 family phage portal protein
LFGSSALEKPSSFLSAMFGGTQTVAGVRVNKNTAMQVSAVFACTRLISDAMATLPLNYYQRDGNDARIKSIQHDHPLQLLMHDLVNPELTSFKFRQIMQTNVMIGGIGCAEVIRGPDGRPKELWPIPFWAVRRNRNPKTGELVYEVTTGKGQVKKLYPEQVFCVTGPGFSNDKPFKPLELAREIIGLALATESFGSSFFANGTNVGGIIEMPGALSDEAFGRFKKDMRDTYEGLGKSHRLMFLEQGSKFHQITVNPNESQFIETRRFQVEEIARFFNVPPHMIMHMERATFNNVEQQNINFVQYSLTSWLKNWEQEIKKSLIMPSARPFSYAKFNVDGLLRGDIKTRYFAYSQGRQWGYLSSNDIRVKEDMNPIGPKGDIYLSPTNMTAADELYQRILAGLDPEGGE